MRILFVSHNSLLRTLGTPKVLIELAESMASLGWETQLVEPKDFGMPPVGTLAGHQLFSAHLKEYLQRKAADFDVVDYEHVCLPFPRSDFNNQTLLVARSALLTLQLERIRIPVAPGPRALARRMLSGPRRQREQRITSARAWKTISSADLVNVNNGYDKAELVRRGVPADKIVVLPLGISQRSREAYESVSTSPPKNPLVGFVGTFDYRKGALDFPKIVSLLVDRVPGVRFKLLGTAGLLQTVDAVKSFFPLRYQRLIEVVPRFDPEQLPHLLSDVSVGIFPSYLEGFGLGVLEMLAAAVPVIAYDVPGPPEMLPPKRLVAAGDFKAMAQKVITLLQSGDELAADRIAARETSKRFNWIDIARKTADAYTARIEQVKSSLGTRP